MAGPKTGLGRISATWLRHLVLKLFRMGPRNTVFWALCVLGALLQVWVLGLVFREFKPPAVDEMLSS